MSLHEITAENGKTHIEERMSSEYTASSFFLDSLKHFQGPHDDYFENVDPRI